MKFNLLKITLLLIFVCSTLGHQHKKEESNTLFSLFGKLHKQHHKKHANHNFRFAQKDKNSNLDSEISFLEKQRKRGDRAEEESNESNQEESDLSVKVTTGPTNYVTEITDTTVMQNWLTVDSEFFKLNKFPSIKTNPGDAKIKLKLNARINERFKVSKTEGARTELFFWFKFKKGYFYYFATKSSMNVLDAILVNKIEDNYVPGDGHIKLPTCFDIYDFQDNKFTICATDMETKLRYLCSIQKFLKSMLDDRCVPEVGGTGKVTIKKDFKSVVIIPVASKNCNEKWDYQNKGSDWECTCKEGISQSPINLPVKQAATPTTLAPMFNYERVDIKPDNGTIDGFVEGSKNIKIRYEKNAIRIFHPNMGKIVNIDGGVFIAEEIVFHTPSEHTIDGKTFDLEMQIIHYGRSKGDIANQVVLSILFKNSPGKYNKFLDKIDFFNLPTPSEPAIELQHDFFIPSVFIDSDEDDVIGMEPFSFYTYEGSLSFPPCTERTTHFVTADPVPLSNTVIQMFKEALIRPMSAETNEKGEIMSVQVDQENENNREIQETNGRNVYLFDHILNGCISYRPPKTTIKRAGHYEKVQRSADEFIQVSGNKPSGIPGSFLVSEQEALGKKLQNK